MSAIIRPPGVVNPSPWEQALATTKRDTAGDWIPAAPNPFGTSVDYTAQSLPGGNPWSAPSTQVPTTAPSTAGWDLPGWAYGGNQKGGATYNQQTGNWDVTGPLAAGSDVFGAKLPYAYDGNQDRGGLEYNGKNVETFWSRALRFARDSGLPPQQAMQAALDRIRRDNGGTLAGTGFQDTGGTGAGPTGTLAQPTPTVGAGGSQGGKTMADQPDGGAPGVLPAPGTTQTVNPALPGTTASGTNFGALGNVDPMYAFNAMQNDPAIAAHYLRLAAGQAGPVTGQLGHFRDSLYGRALQTFLALGGVGGNKAGFGGAQDFLSAMNGGNLQGLLNTAASNASGANFAGQQDTDVEKILRAAVALKSLGLGSLGGSLMSGDLNNLLYAQEGAGIQDSGGASQVGGGLARGLSSDPYGQALQQYLALQR